MLKTLFLILVFTGLTLSALAQAEDKPEAYLFDEFSGVSKSEVKTKVAKLREKLEEFNGSEKYVDVYLLFFYQKKPPRDLQILIRNTLFDNCRDCFGMSPPRIMFVDAGKFKEQKIQFWLVPEGAEPPQIEKNKSR